MTTRRLHYLSGITITVFISIHLFNHVLSIWGAQTHIDIMARLRLFYRNPFIETILLLAVLVQIVSGLKLFITNRKSAVTLFDKIQVWTGLYLAIFFMIHLGAVFFGRLLLHLDTNFYFGVAGLNTFPFSLFFIPYYSLAIISFFAHVSAIHSKKMTRPILGLTPKRQSIAIIAFGMLLTVVIFYGLTNHFNSITVPKEYEVLIGK